MRRNQFTDQLPPGPAGFFSGGDCSAAIGISAFALDRGYFVLGLKVQSRGFLGFKETIAFNSIQWQLMANGLGEFWNDWLSGNWISQPRHPQAGFPWHGFPPSPFPDGPVH